MCRPQPVVLVEAVTESPRMFCFITIESDLPNIIKKSVTIKQVSADVNKLVLFDPQDYSSLSPLPPGQDALIGNAVGNDVHHLPELHLVRPD